MNQQYMLTLVKGLLQSALKVIEEEEHKAKRKRRRAAPKKE